MLAALALFCLALAVMVAALALQLRRLESRVDHALWLARDAQRKLRETRSVVEHECRQLRRAEQQIRVLWERAGFETTEAEKLERASMPPKMRL